MTELKSNELKARMEKTIDSLKKDLNSLELNHECILRILNFL